MANAKTANPRIKLSQTTTGNFSGVAWVCRRGFHERVGSTLAALAGRSKSASRVTSVGNAAGNAFVCVRLVPRRVLLCE